MRIKNSITGKLEEFNEEIIYWYACGPTVYDDAHYGHARTYLATDIIRRILEDYFHKNVCLIMNITDIDDKIIKKGGDGWKALAEKYEKLFWKDMTWLNVKMPDIKTNVSDYMLEMIEYIQTLIDNGWAYVSNGSVYFDVVHYLESGNQFHFREFQDDDMENEYQGEKKNKQDFALWKKVKEGEPSWDAPWGAGRPGWHLECSVMAHFVMEPINGGYLTLHSGGIDLCFPHHENEVIQSTAYLKSVHPDSDKPWCKNFIHTGHLNINGLKMSKSLKNFKRINDFEYDPQVLRMYVLTHRYHKPVDYHEDVLQQAIHQLANIQSFFNFVNSLEQSYEKVDISEMLHKFNITKILVKESLEDDFDTPRASSLMFGLIEQAYKYYHDGSYSYGLIVKIRDYVYDMFNMFGFTFESSGQEELMGVIKKIRTDLRAKKMYDLSDKIRDEYMKEIGLQMMDL